MPCEDLCKTAIEKGIMDPEVDPLGRCYLIAPSYCGHETSECRDIARLIEWNNPHKPRKENRPSIENPSLPRQEEKIRPPRKHSSRCRRDDDRDR